MIFTRDPFQKAKQKRRHRPFASDGCGTRLQTHLPLFFYDGRNFTAAQLSKTTAAIREKDKR